MPPKAQPWTRKMSEPFNEIVESYALPVLGSSIRPLHLESLPGFILIRICSPFWFDFESTEYPQRLAPHCSIRTLPSFSSVSQTPSGELAV
jgi:hypothetical protein